MTVQEERREGAGGAARGAEDAEIRTTDRTFCEARAHSPPAMDTPQAPIGPPIPPELAALTASLDGNLHTLATGNNDIRDAALKAAKCVFDLGMWFREVPCSDAHSCVRSHEERAPGQAAY